MSALKMESMELENRVAVLETEVAHVRAGVGELRAEMREGFANNAMAINALSDRLVASNKEQSERSAALSDRLVASNKEQSERSAELSARISTLDKDLSGRIAALSERVTAATAELSERITASTALLSERILSTRIWMLLLTGSNFLLVAKAFHWL